jgi:hypothetical protein
MLSIEHLLLKAFRFLRDPEDRANQLQLAGNPRSVSAKMVG